MYQLGQLIRQLFLGAVEVATGQLCIFFKRHEGEHVHALDNIRIVDVSPILEEVVGRSLVRIEPNGVACGLTHLLALRVGQQRDRHGICVLAQLAADQLRTAEHVAPLVVAAELHIAAVLLIQHIEVVALHDHVVEFKEAEPLLHTLLVALGAQHVVDREACADLAQKVHVVEVEQPVCVVHHQRFVVREVDEALHLLFEAGGVVLDVLTGQHLAHIGSARGVADHGGAAADQGDRLVARHLQALHQRQRHEVPCRQAVRRAVKADIERRLARVDHRLDLFLVGQLGEKSSCFQFVKNGHLSFSVFIYEKF